MTTASRDDLRTRDGERVRRADLDRATRDPRVAGYEGQDLARRALAGDAEALEQFHARAGLALPGVTEHAEGGLVKLVTRRVASPPGDNPHRGQDRAAFQATNQDGHDSTAVDAAELVAWILSPEGGAALARRGVIIPGPVGEETQTAPSLACSLLDEAGCPIGAEHLPRAVDRVTEALRDLLDHVPEFEGGEVLVDRIAEEVACLHEAAREACRWAGIPWRRTAAQRRLDEWLVPSITRAREAATRAGHETSAATSVPSTRVDDRGER